VRIQQFNDDQGTYTVGPQFAYLVDSIHSTSGPDRSGLVDLVMLPDDTLLALERSAAATVPAIRNRIYEVKTTGATDTNTGALATGLAVQTFTPAAKSLLWSGQVVPPLGANMEGLALGPELPSGNWLLIGVVDNGGSGTTTIASFELSLMGPMSAGDFNRDGKVDGSDYVLWKNTYGSTLALAADGNGNQIVGAADYTVWRNNIVTSAESAGGANAYSGNSVPEPAALRMVLFAVLVAYSTFHRLAMSNSRIDGNSRGRRL
jgi:hypothetical protein